MDPQRYTTPARLLHWLVAPLVAGQFALGWWMQSLPKGPGARADAFNLHKSVGLLILAVMALRLAWRLRTPPPPWPAGVARWKAAAARSNHALLYALLLALPLSGYLGSAFSGYPVRFFGVALPAWAAAHPAAKELLSGVHLAAAWMLAAAFVAHLAGAIHHAAATGASFLGGWDGGAEPRVSVAPRGG